MTRKTLATIATASLIALGGLAIGAGPASAATCPAGQHWNAMGGGSGFCSPNASGGGTGGSIVVDLGGKTPPAPKAPVFTPPKTYTPPKYTPLAPTTGTRVGIVLKADQSGWAKGTVLKYRWTRNGVTISAATSATYKVRSTDKHKSIAVVVTGTKSGRTSSKPARHFFVV